jgi:hypothetical protein
LLGLITDILFENVILLVDAPNIVAITLFSENLNVIEYAELIENVIRPVFELYVILNDAVVNTIL